MSIEEFLAWLEGRSGAGAALGCTDAELQEMLATQGVRAVPDAYASFVRAAGRGAADFWRGNELFYPQAMENHEALEEAWELNGRPFEIPERCYVFASQGGYEFWWFDDVTVAAPVVVRWIEGDVPQRMFRSFEEWLAVQVRFMQINDELHERYLDRGLLYPPNPYPSYDEVRTIH